MEFTSSPRETKEHTMTYSHDTKACAKCGAEFKRSRADRTVNCPSCRESARHRVTSRADEYYVRAGEARARGRAAQAAGDQAAYDRAVSDFAYWSDRRAEEIKRVAAS